MEPKNEAPKAKHKPAPQVVFVSEKSGRSYSYDEVKVAIHSAITRENPPALPNISSKGEKLRPMYPAMKAAHDNNVQLMHNEKQPDSGLAALLHKPGALEGDLYQPDAYSGAFHTKKVDVYIDANSGSLVATGSQADNPSFLRQVAEGRAEKVTLIAPYGLPHEPIGDQIVGIIFDKDPSSENIVSHGVFTSSVETYNQNRAAQFIKRPVSVLPAIN